MLLRFVSGNEFKIQEVKKILGLAKIQVSPLSKKIEELQTDDVESLVRDKCIKAFHEVKRPLFVEHTGLEISALNGFPRGLTQLFWDTVGAKQVSSLFGDSPDPGVIARTTICYCDGRALHTFEGHIKGRISPVPKGSADFQWDCVFVPEGHKKTFAEMGETKNKISMRKLALEKFRDHLTEASG